MNGLWRYRERLPVEPLVTLESAYLDCAGDLLLMLSEGTFPNVGDLAMSRSSPRVGDGFIRLDEAGVVTFASPNAISAYHRMGLAAELEGHNLVAVTRPLIGDPFEAQELANHVRDSLAGGSSAQQTHPRNERRGTLPGAERAPGLRISPDQRAPPAGPLGSFPSRAPPADAPGPPGFSPGRPA